MMVARVSRDDQGNKDMSKYDSYFWDWDYVEYITSITFNDTINIPTDGSVVEQWDMSLEEPGTVIAYLVSSGPDTFWGSYTTESYALYIEAEGDIYLSSGDHFFEYVPHVRELNNFHLLKTSFVESMEQMFHQFSYSDMSFTELDLSNFDTSNVTNMKQMFASNAYLEELDISNFDTSNVTTMDQMFSGCSSLTSLDLTSFSVANDENINIGFMFALTNSMTEIKVSTSKWLRPTTGTNATNVFLSSGVSALTFI